MSGAFDVTWIDHGREPQCAPDPAYPHGKDVDAAFGAKIACVAALPYPAQRCGLYVVQCRTCGASIGVTTAGRRDDPRSVTIACLPKGQRVTQAEPGKSLPWRYPEETVPWGQRRRKT